MGRMQLACFNVTGRVTNLRGRTYCNLHTVRSRLLQHAKFDAGLKKNPQAEQNAAVSEFMSGETINVVADHLPRFTRIFFSQIAI